MSNWGLSHKGLGIRSVAEVAVLYLCTRAFQLLQRDRLRQRSTGLSVNPWQRQTGCTILWGRFNYKWCFHSEPSWNPLFFRRSSSPNPQKGLVWPASEVICLAHIVCHALWMMGKRHSCPNFAESSVNVKTWADRMLMFATERSGMEAGFTELWCWSVAATYLQSARVYATSDWLCSTFAAHLCLSVSSSFSQHLPASLLPRTPFAFISRQRLSPLSKNSTGGSVQHWSQQTGLLCSLECCVDLSCSPLLAPPSLISTSPLLPLVSEILSSDPFPLPHSLPFPTRENRSWHLQGTKKKII